MQKNKKSGSFGVPRHSSLAASRWTRASRATNQCRGLSVYCSVDAVVGSLPLLQPSSHTEQRISYSERLDKEIDSGAAGADRPTETLWSARMASAGNVEAAAALNPTATVQDEAVSQGLNPFGDSRSQRALLAKAIAGESLRNVRKRHDVADDPQGMDRVDENSSKEFAQLGLVQQHEQLMDTDYVLVNEYKNKRMMLADAMDSVYVNLAVVCIVFVDVVSILIYELQAPDEKDCFGRDFPEQEIITICCFSGYVLELLLRGFGNGWRQSYTLERKNADNIFDAAVILGLFACMHAFDASTVPVSCCAHFSFFRCCSLCHHGHIPVVDGQDFKHELPRVLGCLRYSAEALYS